MGKIMLSFDYYFITSSSDNPVTDRPILETVEQALKGGSRVIQYREKALSYDKMLPIARDIRALTRRYNAVFIVNDHPRLALESEADGVHIGQEDSSFSQARQILGSDSIIGVSATTLQEAMNASMKGAGYIGMGPIFSSTTKTDAKKPCGLETLTQARKHICPYTPIVAIGGINEGNYRRIVRSGADGICAISAVLTHEDIGSRVKMFIEGVRLEKQMKPHRRHSG